MVVESRLAASLARADSIVVVICTEMMFSDRTGQEVV